MNARKILIVEDDKVAQKILADTLRAAGYEVAIAHDGAAAVKAAREFIPDLVTLDIELARNSPSDSWDGFSVATWLRRMNEGENKPLIIVISGKEPTDIIQKAAAVGAYTLLPKPFTKQKLLEVVSRALQSRRAPAEPAR
ncbi:MAG TPA: response regulator [Candidatus Acidoferrum sp.]|nr:response regulator [Candidatus Acidoferrum sp.]